MQSRSFLGTIFPVLGLVFALSPLGRAVVPNRIARAASEVHRPVPNTVSPRAQRAIDLGAAPDSLKLNGLMLQFNMSAAQHAALDRLLADQKNPSSTHYRQWLTPEQYGAQFGLSAADMAHVTSWLTAQGFTVTEVARSSNFVTFSGTAAQVQQAFGTTVHELSYKGQRHIANLTDPVLPSAIANVVSNVSGLNDFKPQAHVRAIQAPADRIRPHFTNPNSGSSVQNAVAPADFNTIYDVNPLLGNGLSGAGIGGCSSTGPCGDIAVVGQVDITPHLNDIDAFRTAANLPAGRPAVAIYGTNPGAPSSPCVNNPTPQATCADLEESLFDVEWAGAIAPSAKVLFVTSTNVINSFGISIANNLAPIISMSYGQCEPSIPPSEIVGLTLFLQQASLQGITVIGPTGTDGATDCDTFVNSATKGLAVDFPGSSPFVTAIGGTMFAEGADSAAYWKSTNGPGSGSAIKYIPETVWNEDTQDIAKTPPTFGAGGGGPSAYFTKPAWQKGPGVPSDNFRFVPDISLNAASDHDGYLFCIENSCTGGQFYNSTTDPTDTGYILGGTSSAVPAFASVMALVEESLHQGRLGNINPNIYAMASGNQYNAIFNDITTGNNRSPCTAGSKDCASGGTIGFDAGPGYDQASGWGSINAYKFATEWTSFPPAATGTLATHTTVAPPSSTVAAGTAVSLTITVAPATPPNPNAPPYDPTGSVEIQVDPVAGTPSLAPAVTLVNGQATYSLNTTGLTPGQHTVTVTYSGDSNFGSSSGTATVTISSSGTGTGTGTGGATASHTIVTATPISVAAGAPVSLAIAVASNSTSSNTPAGTVQILLDGATVATSVALSGGDASYSLNTAGLNPGPHPVTVIYSGDANFTGSQGATTITITGTGTPVPPAGSDFTLTPSTASVSTIIGEKLPAIVFTIKPVNGFTGPVTLSASDTSKDGITPIFSANPVVISSTDGGSTKLTFKAFQSLAGTSGNSRFYAAGSGATLACMFLLVFPRRRRWGALLLVLLSVGALGVSGCGSGGTLPTDATYHVTITATAAGHLVHTAAVQVKFSIR